MSNTKPTPEQVSARTNLKRALEQKNQAFQNKQRGDWQPGGRMLRRPEVELRTGLARSTIYDLMTKGLFPRPVRLGKRAVGWPDHIIGS